MKKPAAIVGLAIGDALGQPFEFCGHDMITASDWAGEYRPGSCYKELKPGQWTDDTKMAICLARSLLAAGEFDEQSVAVEYLKWYNSRDLRGIGLQTTRALHNMLEGIPLDECGKIIRRGAVCGNGTAMRVAPLGVFFRNDLVKLVKGARADAVLTHNHVDAKDGSVAVAYISALLANGERPLEAIQETIALLSDGHVKEALITGAQLAHESKKWEDALVIGPQGTAHQTIGTAAFCLLRYCDDGFKHVVCNSVRIGGDTDTRGAIAGAWAGIYNGLDDIPEEYLEELEHGEFLQAIDVLLAAGPEKVKKEKEKTPHSSNG
jgi:ADP-ribosyl-[dinitrogen reductase] hydrolase